MSSAGDPTSPGAVSTVDDVSGSSHSDDPPPPPPPPRFDAFDEYDSDFPLEIPDSNDIDVLLAPENNLFQFLADEFAKHKTRNMNDLGEALDAMVHVERDEIDRLTLDGTIGHAILDHCGATYNEVDAENESDDYRATIGRLFSGQTSYNLGQSDHPALTTALVKSIVEVGTQPPSEIIKDGIRDSCDWLVTFDVDRQHAWVHGEDMMKAWLARFSSTPDHPHHIPVALDVMAGLMKGDRVWSRATLDQGSAASLLMDGPQQADVDLLRAAAGVASHAKETGRQLKVVFICYGYHYRQLWESVALLAKEPNISIDLVVFCKGNSQLNCQYSRLDGRYHLVWQHADFKHMLEMRQNFWDQPEGGPLHICSRPQLEHAIKAAGIDDWHADLTSKLEEIRQHCCEKCASEGLFSGRGLRYLAGGQLTMANSYLFYNDLQMLLFGILVQQNWDLRRSMDAPIGSANLRALRILQRFPNRLSSKDNRTWPVLPGEEDRMCTTCGKKGTTLTRSGPYAMDLQCSHACE